jgi:two-component system LytT family sensor kinase
VSDALLWLAVAAVVVVLAVALRHLLGGSRELGSAGQRATYQALHTASAAVPPLRSGLTQDSAAKALSALRRLLGTPAVALADGHGLLAWDGAGRDHASAVGAPLAAVVGSGRSHVLSGRELACTRGLDCPLRAGVIVPLTVGASTVGALAAFGPSAGAGALRIAGEVAGFASSQLELAELDRSRARATEAELRFLRAQISPHFVYNALTAIASFVRSDPSRARALLLEFAEFTRYTFKSRGAYATLAEELRSVDTYLELERARFGERLDVTLRVAPEVLTVSLPSLILQPLVENAVRHGLEHKSGAGRLVIEAIDADSECLVTIEDDGTGMDPELLRSRLAGRTSDGVGLRNVDERLRKVFGPDHGLTVDTAPGAGTRVALRLPKYAAGVRAMSDGRREARSEGPPRQPVKWGAADDR